MLVQFDPGLEFRFIKGQPAARILKVSLPVSEVKYNDPHRGDLRHDMELRQDQKIMARYESVRYEEFEIP